MSVLLEDVDQFPSGSPVFGLQHGDGCAGLAGAPGATHAMDVVLDVAGEVEVDDVGDVVDVDTTGRHVGSNQYADLARLEVKQGLLTVRLLSVAVNALAVDACNRQ